MAVNSASFMDDDRPVKMCIRDRDKVGVNEDGTGKKPLANATFKVYLSNASGDQLELVASDFTTGVDVPNDTGDYDSSGKAISESCLLYTSRCV